MSPLFLFALSLSLLILLSALCLVCPHLETGRIAIKEAEHREVELLFDLAEKEPRSKVRLTLGCKDHAGILQTEIGGEEREGGGG